VLTDQAFREAVGTAVLAPSLHNSQPWRFRRSGNRITVHADPSRWLRHEDPLGRELLISCGGAVRHLILGLRVQELDVSWELGPDPEDALFVAVVTVTGHRAASLTEVDLHTATRLRHTDRSRFNADAVEPAIIDRLRRLAELEDCFLAELDADDQISLAVLTDHADRLLRTDAGMRDESLGWTSTDLLPAEGVPADELAPRGGLRGSPVTLRRFGSRTPEQLVGADPPMTERPTLLVLGTNGDSRQDWIACGWTLSDLLLALTSDGLVASPLTQPLELPAYRQRLATALALTGHPQMVLRVGYPEGSGSPRTGRRAICDVIR
jgi:hypothetical protein